MVSQVLLTSLYFSAVQHSHIPGEEVFDRGSVTFSRAE